MKRVLLACGIFTVMILISSGCGKKEPERIFNRRYLNPIKESRNEAFFYMVRSYMPGSSITLSIDGRIVWSEGFGFASKDLKVPATRFTKYRIGKVTEVMTALVYNMLVEKGILHPDSSVQHYFPEFPVKEFRLTLQNLADNTSGIRNPTEEEKNWRGLNVSLDAGIDHFSKDSLLFEPGYYQLSTPFNYNLLGVIIQKVTGKKFYEVIREMVTDTLGMLNTIPDNPFSVIENRTNFFDHDYLARVVNALTADIRYKVPSEGYLSTAEDLNRLANAFLFSGYFSDSLRLRTFTPVILKNRMPTQWVNGWFITENHSGTKYYFAKGNIKGGGAAIVIFPEEKMVIAWAANLNDEFDEFPLYSISMKFLNFIHGVPEEGTANNRQKNEGPVQDTAKVK